MLEHYKERTSLSPSKNFQHLAFRLKGFVSFSAMLFFSGNIFAQHPLPSYEIMNRDTTCSIFLYSPGERNGLHLAYYTYDEKWFDIGQLYGSDYAQWGREKRMYHPYVLHANDGTWRLVFQVNDYSPCFAAAYSEDLITWRPQDYPRMREQGVLKPVMFQMDDGRIDIYFKTKDNSRRYVQASTDFRHFTESPEESSISDDAWLLDTATVNGRLYEGCYFTVPKIHLDYVMQYFNAMRQESQLNAETLRDDSKRFAHLSNHINATLTIDVNKTKAISDKQVGVFFEDISRAADGGLYAQLLQNGDFEYSANDHRGWSASTAWKSSKPLNISTDNPLSRNNMHYAVMEQDTLFNNGWEGINDSGRLYDFSIYARNIDKTKNQLSVAIVSKEGEVLAEEKLKITGQQWNRYTVQLNTATKRSIGKADSCQLRLLTRKDGQLAIDMVSLFPHETFKGHGLRKDLAEAIAALHPKFVRFPGGCMSHGQGISNIYHWNESIGPLQDRKPDKNIWGYHQTRGLGFYEFFQFCEDIGAEPLPVLAAGVPCQNSAPDQYGYSGQQGGIAMSDMPAYCQEILNLIEWANGDRVTSKWAKMRAEAGHPAPFNLKYIGIGNEDLISTAFEERYEMICKTIKQKFPDIIVCGTVGPFHYPSADYIEGWKFAKAHHNIIDMVDEHYYETPGWFIHHQDYYDDYDRKGPKVYLGEYASKTRTLESALAEAIHLCSLQRNGDVVAMSSYAPLLCKEGYANWNPNLIYFNNDSITRLTPSYYTQLLFGTHSGDSYVSSRLSLPEDIAYRVAASVVKDSKTGKTYITLVNALPSTLTLNINGLTIPQNTSAVGFNGKVTDKTVQLDDFPVSGQEISLPPYAIRVITIN